jgi:ADP-heptose:LPS heptosyltransferase
VREEKKAIDAVPLSAMQRIVVLRALYLGDMLCATPALRALRKAAPQATITLVSLPWADGLGRRLSSLVDEFAAFPGFPGLPEQPAEPAIVVRFLADMQSRRFDLAIQLHGSGQFVNEAVALFGARHLAGFYEAGGYRPNKHGFIEYPSGLHEVRRQLSLINHLGAVDDGEHLDFPLFANDFERLAAIAPELAAPRRPFVCVHPGGKLSTRRWPVDRFAAVANALADEGVDIVATGVASEHVLVEELCRRLNRPAHDLCGKTDLGTLGALLSRASLVITNDTGVSHVAAALKKESIVIWLGSDAARWAPLDRRRHQVILSACNCRPCEFETCPIGFPCAQSVEPAVVFNMAMKKLEQSAKVCPARSHERDEAVQTPPREEGKAVCVA